VPFGAICLVAIETSFANDLLALIAVGSIRAHWALIGSYSSDVGIAIRAHLVELTDRHAVANESRSAICWRGSIRSLRSVETRSCGNSGCACWTSVTWRARLIIEQTQDISNSTSSSSRCSSRALRADFATNTLSLNASNAMIASRTIKLSSLTCYSPLSCTCIRSACATSCDLARGGESTR
jgi:hypothetical protein